MRDKLSPGFIQAMIWLAAVAFVALVAAIALTTNLSPESSNQALDAEPSVAQPPSPEAPEPGVEDEPEVSRPSAGELDESTAEVESAGPPKPPPVIPDSLRPEYDRPRRGAPPAEPPEPPERRPRPKGITENQFIEASALMVVARESFTDTPEGRKSLAQACDGILQERDIDKQVFEAYSDYLATDPETRERIRDRILERADELREPMIEVKVHPRPRRRSR
jgi:hypothetical protein